MNRPVRPAVGLPPSGQPTRKRVVAGEPPEVLLGRRLKAAYVIERRALEVSLHGHARYVPSANLDGKPSGQLEGRNNKNMWIVQAQRIAEIPADPAEYVRRLFQALHGNASRAPEVAELTDAHYRHVYEQSLLNLPAEIEQAYRTQHSLAMREIRLYHKTYKLKLERAVAQVLENETIAISSLLRYCIAVTMPGERFRKIAANYMQAAAVQYMRCPKIYDEVWGKAIPLAFRERAPRVHELYIRKLLGG